MAKHTLKNRKTNNSNEEFFDIIKEHNQLTTRKLPQLEKRGGDENA